VSKVMPYYAYSVGEDWSRFYTGLAAGESENIAKWLIGEDGTCSSRIDWLVSPDAINEFERTRPFNQKHDRSFFDVQEISPKPSRVCYEQWFERLLERDRLNLGVAGQVVTCEVPVNARRGQNKGRIDLVSVSSDRETIYLLELKKWGSNEPLIRCLIEVYTYFRSMSEEARRRFCKEFVGKDTARIVLCPLIFDDSQAASELKELGPFYKAVEDAIDGSMADLIGGQYKHIAYHVLSRGGRDIEDLIMEATVKAKVAARQMPAEEVLKYQCAIPAK